MGHEQYEFEFNSREKTDQPGAVYLYQKPHGDRPFDQFREITRGRNKGKIEVQVKIISAPQGRSWYHKTVKRVVNKTQIRRYPGR